MQIKIVEEHHNQVDWEVRTPLHWTIGGLIVGAAVFALLVIPSPSPHRWWAVAGVTGGVLAIAVFIAATTPTVDRGHLERLPEGGLVRRTRTWLLVGERSTLEVELDTITGFEAEIEAFEDRRTEPYQLARLWAISTDEAPRGLTDWAEPASALALGEALAKAARLPFTVPGA